MGNFNMNDQDGHPFLPCRKDAPLKRFAFRTKPVSHTKLAEPAEQKTYCVMAADLVISNGHLWFFDQDGVTVRARANGSWEDVWIVPDDVHRHTEETAEDYY